MTVRRGNRGNVSTVQMKECVAGWAPAVRASVLQLHQRLSVPAITSAHESACQHV